MPGPRLLLRFAPLLAALVATAVWLRRRWMQTARLAAAPEPLRIDPPATPVRRFERRIEPEEDAVDIVTIVDDLLEVGHQARTA